MTWCVIPVYVLTYYSHLLRVKDVVSTTAKPSTSSLASYMAQSPPSSPQVQAFKSFTPVSYTHLTLPTTD